jgi:uncharacterized membrane protein YhaH (DUF805 family)
MKHPVWFLRLIFGAWMIPAGLNHFVPLFPQPLGSQPLSHELMVALLDSHLMVVIKLVELIAGLCVFAGFYAPLGLLICVPVSFCVYWWDARLQGAGAAVFGVATLLGNLLLCLAYVPSYRPMFALRSNPGAARDVSTRSGAAAPGPTYETLFVYPNGRTSRAQFVPAFLTLLAAALFYGVLVRTRPGMWCMVVMMIFPALVLHARRLRDMGRSVWLLLVPATLGLIAMAIWLNFLHFGSSGDALLLWAGTAVYAGFALWNCAASADHW